MTSTRLGRIDLSTDSQNTLAALIKLLIPHVPYSLHILGCIFNAGPRSSTLSDVDLSKVTLWSTIPIHSDAIPPTDVHTLFSVVIFSSLGQRFHFFCSSESQRESTHDGPESSPTKVEEAHVKQVFVHLLDIAREARPRYDSAITSFGSTSQTHRVDTDPPMIRVCGVHAKWSTVLASISISQRPVVQYAFPPGSDQLETHADRLPGVQTSELGKTLRWPLSVQGVTEESKVTVEMEISDIGESDLPFVHGASRVPRTQTYLLSRAPYSVCLREMGADERQTIVCALIHCDGSIGALRVDPRYQRQGLGKWVIRALVEKMDFSKGRGKLELAANDGEDLGGGALGWNWANTGSHNEAANQLFTSLVEEENV